MSFLLSAGRDPIATLQDDAEGDSQDDERGKTAVILEAAFGGR